MDWIFRGLVSLLQLYSEHGVASSEKLCLPLWWESRDAKCFVVAIVVLVGSKSHPSDTIFFDNFCWGQHRRLLDWQHLCIRFQHDSNHVAHKVHLSWQTVRGCFHLMPKFANRTDNFASIMGQAQAKKRYNLIARLKPVEFIHKQSYNSALSSINSIRVNLMLNFSSRLAWSAGTENKLFIWNIPELLLGCKKRMSSHGQVCRPTDRQTNGRRDKRTDGQRKLSKMIAQCLQRHNWGQERPLIWFA